MYFDIESNVDVSIQIYEKLKDLIKTGIYSPNDKLPSCREISKRLLVNPNTVMKAYKMLEDEKYVYSINKKGYYIYEKYDKTESQIDIYTLFSKLRDNGYSKKELKQIIDEVYGKSNDYMR